jgi:hypothetical protein
MRPDIAPIYEAALSAVNEGLGSPLGEATRAFAAQIAATENLQLGAAFVTAALRLDLARQGTLLWNFNKGIDDPSLRGLIARLIAGKMPQIDASGHGDAAKDFSLDGLLNFPRLVSPVEAREMLAYFEQCTEVTRQETLVYHRLRDIVRAPHVFRIATDEKVLAVARHHLGGAPAVVQMDAWWSLPERENPVGPQIFHRDRDDFRACKLFVYLSDVTSGDGPHIFVRGSHRQDMVREVLAAKGKTADPSMFFSKSSRSFADKLEGLFGPAVAEMTGPAGTCFLENTYGFHRGKVPTTGRRCVFQVLYAAVPYPHRLNLWRAADLTAPPVDCAATPLARSALRFAIPNPQ